MDNSVTISKNKENILEFEVDIQGVDTLDMSVRFIIETDGMKLGFDSVKQNDKKWSVKIPALPILKTASYPFHIDITVDGYHFMPLVGDIKVVESESVTVSKPENISLAPSKKSLEDIVNMSKAKTEPPKEEKPKTEEIDLVKPERKFKMEPVEVKDSGKIFKTIADIANTEKEKNSKKEEKKSEPKKEKTKPKKENKKVEVKEEAVVPIEVKEEPKKEEINTIRETDAKDVAKNILQDVTGLGKPKQEITEKDSKGDKVKNILKEETVVPEKPKQEIKEAGGIKKITKDKKVIEVDKSKEESIKKALKENTVEDKRSITTVPFKKKDVTIH